MSTVTTNQTVVVTGAAGGIGLEVARTLATLQYRVLGVDVAADTTAVMDSVDGHALGVRADLTDPAGREQVAQAAGDQIAGLVNCAGITRDGLLPNLEDAAIGAVIDVNAVSAAHLSQLLAGRIVPGGAIVNIASRAALGNIGQVNYAASKGALIGLTKALSLQLAPDVRVNAVAPGLIATDMTAAMPERVVDKLVARTPLQRSGEPEEVANVIAELLGPATSYVTGQVVYVCGGRSV